MKTLQITGNSAYGGGGYLLLKWCKYLADRDWQVDVLSTDPIVIDELRTINGVRIHSHIFIPRDIHLPSDWIAFWQILKLMKKEKYDVVQTYTATPGFIGRLAAHFARIPKIFHHQAGWTVTDFSSRLEKVVYKPLEYFAAAISTKSICVSKATYMEAKRKRLAPMGKLITICNGIDAEPFLRESLEKQRNKNQICKELGLTTGCILIGNTGRLSPQKDNQTLIRAGHELKQRLHDSPFAILLIGDGPDRPILESLTRDLELEENIKFLGFRQDIPKLLSAMDVFVSPSLREGLSISLMEAMACGVPIVAASILPNMELIINNYTGLLVAPKNPKQIAQAIMQYLDDETLMASCAGNAQKAVTSDYTISRMFEETWNLYSYVSS